MKKCEQLGRVLSRADQKKIIGGLRDDGGGGTACLYQCVPNDTFAHCVGPVAGKGSCGTCHCTSTSDPKVYDIACNYCSAE